MSKKLNRDLIILFNDKYRVAALISKYYITDILDGVSQLENLGQIWSKIWILGEIRKSGKIGKLRKMKTGNLAILLSIECTFWPSFTVK